MKMPIVAAFVAILAAGCSATTGAKPEAQPTVRPATEHVSSPFVSKNAATVNAVVTGTDLNQVHNEAYKAFVAALESRMKQENVRFSNFAVVVQESSSSGARTYSVGYSVKAEPAGAKPPHRVADVRSTVWRETGKASAEAKKRNAKIVAEWEPKMRKAYHVVGKETATYGNESLFHAGTIVYATGSKK